MEKSVPGTPASVGPFRICSTVHCGVKPSCGSSLGREQEALRRAGLAGGLGQLREHAPLVGLVHALVDLVHHAEGAHRHVLREGGMRVKESNDMQRCFARLA